MSIMGVKPKPPPPREYANDTKGEKKFFLNCVDGNSIKTSRAALLDSSG